MVTDEQVRRLMRQLRNGKSLVVSAARAGMDEKTARRYRGAGRLPSELRAEHDWRTRLDPFEAVWQEVRPLLKREPRLEAKTLFEDLQRRYPGRFSDGQLRTLQRRVKQWRATEGPMKEVMFAQRYHPGKLCESDFTHMTSLGITLGAQAFPHMIYHFVLPYSNWETGTVCFSESFESLSEGLQNALWELGGVPEAHRTDQLTTAVHKTDHPQEFTQRYRTIAKSVSENTPLSGPAEVLLDGNTALVLTPGLIDYSRLLLQQTQVRNYTSFADWIADGCFPESPCPYRKH